MASTAAGAPTPVSFEPAVGQQAGRDTQETQQQGPPVIVDSRDIVIEWGEDRGGLVPYTWEAVVENPNEFPVGVKVRLDFVNEQGEVLYEDAVVGQVGPQAAVALQQSGSLRADVLDRVHEARGEPSSWWIDDAYKIRTLATFADGLQRMEVFFVLEDWQGRPVTASGTVDLYIVEKERARAEFAGGGMRRRMTTLYARRFNVNPGDFAKRQIGFINTDYAPPALTLGPIHYSMFDQEPRGDEGLVRVVFHTAAGTRIVAEDRIFF